MKIEIPHSKDSEDYINKTFSMYTYGGELPRIFKIEGRSVFHMYPKEDTMIDGEDHLSGYVDAYNCNVKVYDVKNRIFYDTYYVDAIEFDIPSEVKVFKDLSTMIAIGSGVEIMNGHAISVYRIGKYDNK